MLDKLIIHLKNIIFFKAVIYGIIIITLFTLIPIFSHDLEKSSIRNIKSYDLLQESKFKLTSIVNFKDKILNTKKNYKALILKEANQGCLDRTALINKIASLNKKHSLFEPIFVRISKEYPGKETQNYSSNVLINNYTIKISFKSKNPTTMLMICSELYKFFPYGSVISNINIETLNALTPDVIGKLTTKNSPGFLSVKMNVKLREIVYEH